MMEVLRVLCGLLMLVSVVVCAEEHQIEWTPNGVQQRCHKIQVQSGDSLKFTCPIGSYSTIWYMVAPDQYNGCGCRNKTCLRPAFCPGFIEYSYTVDIVRNSEQLGNAQDYQPGRTYYFASFSNGGFSDLNSDSDSGGECVSVGLRLEVEVLPTVETCICDCGEEAEGSGTTISSEPPPFTPSSSVPSVEIVYTPAIELGVTKRECDDPLSFGGAFGIGVAVGAAAMVILASVIVAVALLLRKCLNPPKVEISGPRNMGFELYDVPRKDDSHIYDNPSKLMGK